jgi:hypothetical protein
MLIFRNEDGYHIFIHIPKNGGKFIRNEINENEIVKRYWGVEQNLDLAHIPYMKKDKFIENREYEYFTYTRCPYDRIISGFFYKNPDKDIDDLMFFIKNTLPNYNFSMDFNCEIIHYYPQYLFVCHENLIIQKIKINKINGCPKYDLSKYFDAACITIINNIYMKDFLFFDYEMLN